MNRGGESSTGRHTFVFDRAQSGDREPIASNENNVVRTSTRVDEASDSPIGLKQQTEDKRVTGLRTPCLLEGERVIAFVDSGASVSFVSQKLVERMGWPVAPRLGNIQQCLTGSSTPRLGAVESLVLENGSKRLKVDLEVADLGGEEELIIGDNLFRLLGYRIQGVPITWPETAEEPSVPEASLKLGAEGGQSPLEPRNMDCNTCLRRLRWDFGS